MRGYPSPHDRTIEQHERVVQLAAKSLAEMTDKQLESEWTKAAKELQRAKDTVRQFSEEHQRRVLEAQAQRRLDTMSDAEKAVLVQMVQAEGVPSEMKAGGVRG